MATETTFALTHSFDDRYGAPSFATGWELCLAGLRARAGRRAASACPIAASPGTKQLVHEFGLDQPEVANPRPAGRYGSNAS